MALKFQSGCVPATAVPVVKLAVQGLIITDQGSHPGQVLTPTSPNEGDVGFPCGWIICKLLLVPFVVRACPGR